jgi:5,10-methenyltetrahydromethanopterin hydrogenase
LVRSIASSFSSSNNYKNINKWLAELKNIDSSLKTLDKEITTNAKLISGWGTNEGDDLTDVCQRMTQLMEEVGLIHQAYSIRHTAYRKLIKSLKTQEMTLDDVRTRVFFFFV